MHNRTAEREFERALEDILVRVFHMGNAFASGKNGEAKVPEPIRIAVAYSGGVDSTVLLHLAHSFAKRNGYPLFAFHVHHGLNRLADDWLDHCEKECLKLGIHFDSRRVRVDRHSGEGIEAEARLKRYRALGEMCRGHKVPLLLVAHHENDQIETVLFQLMRGAGVAGLSGMEPFSHAPELLNDDKTVIGRPLLSLSRQELESCLSALPGTYVSDDSNDDRRFTRNVIRHELVPVLSELFPGFQKRLARTALHAQSAQRLLEEVAAKDIEFCGLEKDELNMECLRLLNPDRVDNVLRYWLMINGVRMPSTAWMMEARRQLTDSREDARIRLSVDGFTIRRYRQVLMIGKEVEIADVNDVSPVLVHWTGEKAIALEQWRGTLYFEEAGTGFDPDWLKGHPLQIGSYQGSAELKLAGRPTKKLKILYQEAGIPAWERPLLPLVFVGNELVYAAGIGISAKYLNKTGKCVRIRWERDT